MFLRNAKKRVSFYKLLTIFYFIESPTTTEEPTTPTASTTPGPVNVRLSTAERATDMAGDLQSTTESATASTTDNGMQNLTVGG